MKQIKIIKKLSKGKITLGNDGTKKQLMEILKLAFPKDHYDYKLDEMKILNRKYYQLSENVFWNFCNSSNLPIVKVSEYFKSENNFKPKKGKKYYFSVDGKVWEKGIYLATFTNHLYPYAIVMKTDEQLYKDGKAYNIKGVKLISKSKPEK